MIIVTYYLNIFALYFIFIEKIIYLDLESFFFGSFIFTLEFFFFSRGGESDLERDFLRVSGERRFIGDLFFFLFL